MDGLSIELESEEVIVGQPIRGRVVGTSVVKDVVLRAQELRGTTFHHQDEARSTVEPDGSFELSGPLQPSFFGDEFSIEWMVVARAPTREIEHVVHVVAPMETRRFDVGKSQVTTEREAWGVLVGTPAFAAYLLLSADLRLGWAGALVVAGLTILAGLSISLPALWRYRVFGQVRFDLDSSGRYEVEFHVRRNVELQRLFLRARCSERAPGRSRSLVPRAFRRIPTGGEQVVEAETDVLPAPREVRRGEDVRLDGTLALGRDAPFTLRRYPAPSLVWEIELWSQHDGVLGLLARQELLIEAPKLLEYDGEQTLP